MTTTERMKSEVESVQKIVSDTLFSPPPKPAKAETHILLQTIAGYPAETLCTLFGDFGFRLSRFLQDLDYAHPDIQNILNDKETRYISQAIRINQKAVEEQWPDIVPLLGEAVTKRIREATKEIDSPAKTQRGVRLIASEKKRDEIRRLKYVRLVDFESYFNKADDVWRGLITSMGVYARHNSEAEKEIERANQKVQRFRKLRLSDLEAEIAKGIEVFRKKLKQEFLGFHRVGRSTVVMIVCKLHGFELKYTEVGSGYHSLISRKMFDGFDFGCDAVPETMSMLPRAYPLYALWDHAPEGVRKIVAHLEAFPEYGGKPLFDHYDVVVPGVAFPVGNSLFRGHMYPSVELAQQAMELELIKEGRLIPVLLGDRDGASYFISYWV